MAYDNDIILGVELDPGDVKRSAQKMQKDIQDTFDKINLDSLDAKQKKVLNRTNDLLNKSVKLTKELEAAQGRTKFSDTYVEFNRQLEKNQKSAESLQSELTKLQSVKIPTEEFTELNSFIDTTKKDISKTNAAIDRLISKKEEIRAKNPGGTDPKLVAQYAELDKQLEQQYTLLENQKRILGEAKEEMQELQAAGKDFTLGDPAKIAETEAKLKEAREAVLYLSTFMEDMKSSGQAFVSDPDLEKINKLKLQLTSVNNELVIHKALMHEAADGNKEEGDSAEEAATKNALLGLSFKSGFKMLLKYGLGIRSVFMLFRKLRAAVMDGLKSMAQFNGGSNTLNQSISSIKNSLEYVKNSWVTAFAPIVDFVAPAISRLLDMLAAAGTAVAKFFAMLSGKHVLITAVKQQTDYAKSLDKTAGAADKARGSLAGFDDLDVLNSDNGSGGGGAGSGTPSPDDLFEETVIDDWELHIEEAFDRILERFSLLGEQLIGIWESVIGAFTSDAGMNLGEELITMFEQVFELLVLAIGTFWADMGEILITPLYNNRDLIQQALEGLLKFLGSIVNSINQLLNIIATTATNIYAQHISPLVNSIVQGATDIWKAFWSMWNEQVQPILDDWATQFHELVEQHLGPLFEQIGKFVGSVADLISYLWNTWISPLIAWLVANVLPVVLPIIQTAGKLFMDFVGLISDLIGGLLKVFGGLIDFVVGIFTGDWEKAWNGVNEFTGGSVEVLFSIINGISTMFTTFINGIIGFLNKVFDAINSIQFDIPDWVPFVGGKHFGLSLPHIDELQAREIKAPGLAQGAVIPPNQEFLAVLGDQKQGTNIEAPLDTIVEAFRSVVGNMEVQNTGYSEMVLDGEVFARLVVPYVVSELNRQGYNVNVLEGSV